MKKELSQEQKRKCFRKLPKVDQRRLIDALLLGCLQHHSVESTIQLTMDILACSHSDVIAGLKRVSYELDE